MPLRENELARRTTDGLEVRAEPLRVRWEFPDLVTADGHELRCVFTGSVRALPDRTERRMLEELLLDGRTAAFSEDVARHFFPAFRGAATRIAQAHEARETIENDEVRRALIDGFKAAALPVAFACGLEVLPPFQADLQSPTYERQRVRAMQQSLAEKEAAGQVERFQRASELFRQFENLRAAAPQLSAGRILDQINPADRGSLMQSLLMAGAGQQSAGAIWAVAGPSLIRVAMAGPIEGRTVPRPELFTLPVTLGPLRSIACEEIDGRPMLLIGAQHGVLVVNQNDLSDVTAYADADFESPLGFNRVVYWPQRRQFCATHSEAGLVCWDCDAPKAPATVVRSAALGVRPNLSADSTQNTSASISMRVGNGPIGPRNLQLLDSGQLIFSIGGRLLIWDGDRAKTLAEPNSSETVKIIHAEQSLFTVHEDGTLCAIDAKSGAIMTRDRRFPRVRAAGALPWLGGLRILAAGDDGPVQCVGPDDPVVTQYCSPYKGLRSVYGSPACVAAVSPDRQRAIVWNSWDGRQPAAELFLGALARHRIADLAIS